MASEPFRLGLVLAGAVSAGAYSAGVMDFLIEALDEYDRARMSGTNSDGAPWTGPVHGVVVPVMSGASAGGMTAAIAALQMFSEFQPFRSGEPKPPADRNRLYASWVDEIDVTDLLKTADLDRNSGLRSVLSSAVLEDIVRRTLQQRPAKARGWVGESGTLTVVMTVSNLGGVPYEFPLKGSVAGDAYGMLNHGDDLGFRVGLGAAGQKRAGFTTIDLATRDPVALGRFGAAALATGAFPIGLAARPLTRPFADYTDNPRVGYDFVQDGNPAFKAVDPKPVLPSGDSTFVAVDGGVIDNEPFELTRRVLSGSAAKNPANRDGIRTAYAVLLIDPFPNRPDWPPLPKTGETPRDKLSEIVFPLISTVVDQSRFKPQELSLALDDSVFSRHMIAPEPEVQTPASRKLPIASGALGGFSGFLDRSFRHHDYLLGRRNAQAFLRWHLNLPDSNPLFGDFPRNADTADWFVRDISKAQPGQAISPDGDAVLPLRMAPREVPVEGRPVPPLEPLLPIIPLTRRMLEPIVIGPADRPRPGDLDLDALESLLSARLTGVVRKLVDEDLVAYVPNWFVKVALKWALPKIATKRAMEAIRTAKSQIEAAFPG